MIVCLQTLLSLVKDTRSDSPVVVTSLARRVALGPPAAWADSRSGKWTWTGDRNTCHCSSPVLQAQSALVSSAVSSAGSLLVHGCLVTNEEGLRLCVCERVSVCVCDCVRVCECVCVCVLGCVCVCFMTNRCLSPTLPICAYFRREFFLA